MEKRQEECPGTEENGNKYGRKGLGAQLHTNLTPHGRRILGLSNEEIKSILSVS